MELLDQVEVRVLGALMEKEATTPEYYPLSLNALVNACNQKTNRDPVTSYDEDTVADALASLREKRFALTITGGSRVNKYQQRISETLNLGRRESAVLCVLFLRGPQTLGEIKDRSERMFSFADLAETEAALDRLDKLALRNSLGCPARKKRDMCICFRANRIWRRWPSLLRRTARACGPVGTGSSRSAE